MKQVIWIIGIVLFATMWIVSCGKAEQEKTNAELAKTQAELDKMKEEAKFGRYRVTLTKLNIAELDWNRNTMGDPLNIKMTFYKDGNPVHSILLDGTREERKPHEGSQCTFEIDNSRSSKYVIKWEEQAIIAKKQSYTWGENGQPGNWPFGGTGRLKCKQGSWFEFSAEKIQ